MDFRCARCGDCFYAAERGRRPGRPEVATLIAERGAAAEQAHGAGGPGSLFARQPAPQHIGRSFGGRAWCQAGLVVAAPQPGAAARLRSWERHPSRGARCSRGGPRRHAEAVSGPPPARPAHLQSKARRLPGKPRRLQGKPRRLQGKARRLQGKARRGSVCPAISAYTRVFKNIHPPLHGIHSAYTRDSARTLAPRSPGRRRPPAELDAGRRNYRGGVALP